jgi:Cu/Ag efflux pump CusA
VVSLVVVLAPEARNRVAPIGRLQLRSADGRLVPLRDVAAQIGVDLDWIYLGRKDGLPFKLAIEISKLEKELEKEGREPNRNWIDLGDGPSPSEN